MSQRKACPIPTTCGMSKCQGICRLLRVKAPKEASR